MKKLGLLFLVFAALAAFVYFYEIEGKKTREQAEASEKSLLGWTEDDISTLEIDRAGSDPIVMGRIGSQWRITRPVQGTADRFTVDGLLRNLAEAQKNASFEEGVEDLAEYGLAEPKVTLKVTSADGVQKIVELGGEDYTGLNVYAKLKGEPAIHLTEKKLLAGADRELKDWRSKTVLDIDQDLVVRIEIQNPSGRLVLDKKTGTWALLEPIADPAEESAVTALLSALRYSRIDRFVAESSDDLQSYGLDEPAFRVRIQEAGDDGWKVLELGKTTAGDNYFARDPSRPQVFTVRNDVAEKLSQDVWEFRQKAVVNVSQEEVDRFQILRGEAKLNVRRAGGGFTVTFPEDMKGQNAPPYKFFYPATDAKFESIDEGKSGPDDPRFQNPDIFIEITKTDGTVLRFEFVKRGEKAFARQVETGRSGEISAGAFNKLTYEPTSVTG